MKTIRTKELAQVLLDLTDGKEESVAKKSVKEFASFLHKKGMISESEKIISEYRILYNEKHNIVEATVTLTERLPEKTRISLRESLKKKYKAREVHMLEKVDERIIGGLKIKVGDEVLDMTAINTLNQLKTKLLSK